MGNLEGETLSLSELFANVDNEIHDLVVNREKIFVVTTNMLWEKNAILKSEDGGETWEVVNESNCPLRANFDTRGSDRLYGTRDNILLYSDDFGANWTELCTVSEDASDYINNFVQREDKIYVITSEFKVYQIDLSQFETSIEAISADNSTIAVDGNQITVQTAEADAQIEIYNLSGTCIYRGTDKVIFIPERGVYIIKAGAESFKVAI